MTEMVNCIHCRRYHSVNYLCPQARKAGVTKQSPIEAFTNFIDPGEDKPAKKPDSSAQKRPQIDDNPKPESTPRVETKRASEAVTLRDRERENARRWRERNPEKYKESQKRYRENNRERLREKHREYMKAYRKKHQ